METTLQIARYRRQHVKLSTLLGSKTSRNAESPRDVSRAFGLFSGGVHQDAFRDLNILAGIGPHAEVTTRRLATEMPV